MRLGASRFDDLNDDVAARPVGLRLRPRRERRTEALFSGSAGAIMFREKTLRGQARRYRDCRDRARITRKPISFEHDCQFIGALIGRASRRSSV